MTLLRRAALVHRGWRYRLRVDPDEIRWMLGVLGPGDVAVDIGAYKGGYTYWMRRGVGPAGEVIAVEPQPDLAEHLRDCVSDFRWRNVRVEEVALSSRVGTRTLRLPGASSSPAASLVGASLPEVGVEYEVETRTLDEVLASLGARRQVRLIKCDVEGHELDVFRGAADTLRESRPHLLFECEPRHLCGHTLREVFGYLEGLGYRGFFFREGSRTDVDEFDARVHQVEGRRPYLNNFVFTPQAGGAGR